MAQAKLRFDAPRPPSAPHAPRRRAAPAGGTTAGVDVPLALTPLAHGRPRVGRRGRPGSLPRAARRDASAITLRHMLLPRVAASGRRARHKRAAAAERRRRAGRPTPRALHQRLRQGPPASVTAARPAPRTTATVITVDRDHFKLRLFKRLQDLQALRHRRRHGRPRDARRPLPIQDKQVNPAWHVPEHARGRARSPGQTIPGGRADNPLKARWMGIANGVGIHGTAEDWSIGSRASHGCIRMHVSDVIDLYGGCRSGRRC